jgi:ribosomal-protein-alanine N-acetyltransferase
MKPQFLPLTKNNSQACFELHTQGQYSPWSRKVFDDCLSAPYFAYSLNQNDQVLGYYIGMSVLDEVTLMDIVISKNNRGQGNGKLLLSHLLNHCSEQKVQQVWLEVRESNKAAIHLYDKAGFVVAEQRANYYPSANGKEDALIMCSYLG